MVIRGDDYFGGKYWVTAATVAGITIIRLLLFGPKWYPRSRYPNVQRPLEPFKYAPINEGDIRLLLIYPRHPEGPVKCALFQTHLSSVPRFEALSYCWGNSERNKEISVNGRSVMITSNALEVLKIRSSFWEPKLVWIDSICIDQSNDEEKDQQVKRMKDIYSKAFVVYVVIVQSPEVFGFVEEAKRVFGGWANSISSDVSDSPDHIIERFKYHGKYIIALTVLDVLYDLRLSFLQIEPDEFDMYYKFVSQADSWRMKNFREFLSNPWFKRVWVVQEMALAPSLRVMYGNVEIQWDDISDVMGLLAMHRKVGIAVLEIEGIGIRRLPPAGCDTFGTMMSIRRRVRDADDISLAELLRLTREFEAKDMRDKVFAIHGICKNLPEILLPPTYGDKITTADVFLDAATCLVSQGDAARVLSDSGCISATSSESTLSLPSWVPDWSRTQTAAVLSFVGEEIDYKAGGKGPMNARPLVQSLFLDGYPFDTIQYLGPDLGIDPNLVLDPDIIHEKWTQLFGKTCSFIMGSKLTKDPYTWVDNQSLSEACCRTLMGNRTNTTYPASSDDVETFGSMIYNGNRILLLAERPGDAAESEMRRLFSKWNFESPSMRCWAGRIICITGKGCIGAVPPLSKVGDEIVVFVGMQTPSVLRKVEVNGVTKRQNIGECYMHGLMDGEILEMGIRRQEFELA